MTFKNSFGAVGVITLSIFGVQEMIPKKNEIIKAPKSIPAKNVRMEETSDEKIKMLVTAYCLCEKCCGKWSQFARTATGDDAGIYDGVAADPKLLPYRTKLNIPGIGIREVDDTGGAMRQDGKRGIYHIDVRFPTHEEARKWGKKWLNIAVLETQNKGG